MTAQLRVRAATPDDAPALGHIQTEAWRASYPNPALGITDEAIEAALRRFNADGDERLRSALARPDGRTWVACDGEMVVGFVGVLGGDALAVIEALHVLPNYQGQGIGPRLLERALAWLGATKPTALDVVAYNERAIRLYESYGVSRDESAARGYIRLGETARIPLVRMVKARAGTAEPYGG